jgi:hypothetical protein
MSSGMINFYNTIPATNNNPSNDQPLMLEDNQAIAQIWDIDHVGFNTNFSGTHEQVTFNVNQSAPSIAGSASGLYTNLSAGIFGNLSTLFFQYFNGMSVNQVQLTNLSPFTGNDGLGGGYSVFNTPWGINIFTGSTPLISTSGSYNGVLSGTQGFGSVIYTSVCTPFGGNPAAVNFSPANSTKNFVIKVDFKIAVRWLVLSN